MACLFYRSVGFGRLTSDDSPSLSRSVCVGGQRNRGDLQKRVIAFCENNTSPSSLIYE